MARLYLGPGRLRLGHRQRRAAVGHDPAGGLRPQIRQSRVEGGLDGGIGLHEDAANKLRLQVANQQDAGPFQDHGNGCGLLAVAAQLEMVLNIGDEGRRVGSAEHPALEGFLLPTPRHRSPPG